VSFLLIGVGGTVSADIGGLGTKWRRVSMNHYDRRGGLDTHERNTRRFQIYYRGLTIFGFLVFVGGLLSLLL
jgi:hypothetical protein